MASRSRTRSPVARRDRSYSRSRSDRTSDYSRSPRRGRRYDSRSLSRSPTPPPRRNGRYRSDSRSMSGRDSRDRSLSPPANSTKIVVERLSKNVNENHLYEIFGQFGRIRDLDLPMQRTYNTNRGAAYILFDQEEDAEDAITHMHEAQIDGTTINVSIVLPRRKISPPPPVAQRGANIDPRVPAGNRRGRNGPPDDGGFGGGRRRGVTPPGRYGSRSDAYRHASRSMSRSPFDGPAGQGSGRYRTRSPDSYSSRSRSRSPGVSRRGRGRDHDDYDSRRRSRSPSYAKHRDHSASRSLSRGRDYR